MLLSIAAGGSHRREPVRGRDGAGSGGIGPAPATAAALAAPGASLAARRALASRRRETRGSPSTWPAPDVVQLRFVRKPRAGLLFDVRSGRVLWRLNPTRRLAIASLTKMMTALWSCERRDPHERVRITKRAVHTPGSAVGVLPKGKKVQLEALLNGLLLVSGNDAAVALAQHTGGSVAGFVRMMNERARQLGPSCTRFTSAARASGRGQPLLRRRPRDARARRPPRPPHPAHRAARRARS